MEINVLTSGRIPRTRIKMPPIFLLTLIALLFTTCTPAQPVTRVDIALEPPKLDNVTGFDSMAEIYREGLNALQNANLGPMTRRHGLENMVLATRLSGITIMPTTDVPETEKMFEQGLKMRHGIIDATDKLLEDGNADDALTAYALDVAAMQKATIDTLMTLARWTRKYDPNLPTAKKLARNIRAPFIPFAAYRTPHKEIRTGEIGEGECFIVLKEIQGIKAKLIPELIPVWLEPWYQRRRIVGYKVVWRLQWMPAEWVKRLSTCKEDGELRHDDHQKIIYEPLLLDLWGFYGKRPH